MNLSQSVCLEVGDPSASTFKFQYKLKTVLCRNIVSFGKCDYGRGCRYAHSLLELRGQTVREKMKAGNINDPSTFRTRPCFDFVSTGTCPYGDRCMDLHDPQIANNAEKHWLDCIQFNDESHGLADVNVHIDGSRETKRAMIHQNEAFGPNTLGMMSSYESFKSAVCNYLTTENENALVSKEGFLPFLMIIKNMLGALERSTFPFVPTHVFYDRACMILQEKYFFVPSSTSKGTFALEISDKDNFNALKNRYSSPGYTVVRATEVAFGSPGSTFALDPPAIWFDIPQDAIKKSSISRIKMTTSRTKSNSDGKVQLVPLRRFLTEKGRGGPMRWAPFSTYFSNRRDMRQLISNTINLKIHELLQANSPCQPPTGNMTSACHCESHLEVTFNSIKAEHVRYGWPVNEGRDVRKLDIPAPDAESKYCIASSLSNDYTFARKIYSSFSFSINSNTGMTETADLNRKKRHIYKHNTYAAPRFMPKICKNRLEPLFTETFEDAWAKVKSVKLRDTRR